LLIATQQSKAIAKDANFASRGPVSAHNLSTSLKQLSTNISIWHRKAALDI